MSFAVVATDKLSHSEFASETQRLLLAGVLFWLILAGPAWLIAENRGLLGLSVSGVLCVVPGILALIVRAWLKDNRTTVVLVSNGLRMVFVLVGALSAKLLVSGYGMREFFAWLILFYLFTLAVETWFAFRRNVPAS